MNSLTKVDYFVLGDLRVHELVNSTHKSEEGSLAVDDGIVGGSARMVHRAQQHDAERGEVAHRDDVPSDRRDESGRERRSARVTRATHVRVTSATNSLIKGTKISKKQAISRQKLTCKRA